MSNSKFIQYLHILVNVHEVKSISHFGNVIHIKTNEPYDGINYGYGPLRDSDSKKKENSENEDIMKILFEKIIGFISIPPQEVISDSYNCYEVFDLEKEHSLILRKKYGKTDEQEAEEELSQFSSFE